MNRPISIILAAAIAAVSTGSTVLAADYDPPIYVEEAPEYVPVEVGSGWYLRGDVGYNFKTLHNSDTYSLGPVTNQNNFRDSLTAGVGFGYRFTDYIRADATVDRVFGSDFTSRFLLFPNPATGRFDNPIAGRGNPCNGYRVDEDGNRFNETIENCLQEDGASYNSWMLMGNIYADLGTYAGFTPYIGGGIGAARVAWSETTGSITCVPQNAQAGIEGCTAQGSINQPAPNTVYTEKGEQNSGVDYRLAWSVTAGLSYLLTQNLSLDAAYKYTQVGNSSTAIVYNNQPGSSLARDGFGLHQVKVGLRYALW